MENLPAKLAVAFEAGMLPVMAWGVPGLGKTDIVRQFAATKGLPCVVLQLSQMEAPDLLGLPKALLNDGAKAELQRIAGELVRENLRHGKLTVDDGAILRAEALLDAVVAGWRTRYITPAWWPTEPTVLFLDELNRAQRFEINAVHQLVLEQRLFQNKLPAGSFIVAACNPPSQEELGLTAFGDAFWDRFAHVEVKTSAKAWLKWARSNHVHGSVVEFIDSQTEVDQTKFLNTRTMDFKQILDHVHPTQRSWARVGEIMGACDRLGGQALQIAGWPLIRGVVGDAMSNTFQSFHNAQEEPIIPAELMTYVPRQNVDPRFDFSPDRIPQAVREKIKRWGERGRRGRLPLLRASIDNSAAHALEIYRRNGGRDTYAADNHRLQADLGNFFEAISLCPASVQAAFFNESAPEWSDIASMADMRYINHHWMIDVDLDGQDRGGAGNNDQ